MRRFFVGIVLLISLASVAAFAQLGSIFGFGDSHFTPKHRISGIGVDRHHLSDELLQKRVDLMIASQTFIILRDPHSLAGAERITGPKLWPLFEKASQQSGVPTSLIAAVAYLESWGEANAESPGGPKGIMQIAEATARSMGLKVYHTTLYKTSKEKRAYKNKRGKTLYKVVAVRTPYQVVSRDERLMPDLAVPAAANYLARVGKNFGSIDWAIFAYHCGEGCTAEVQGLVQRYLGDKQPATVARAFFSAYPGHDQDLYEAIARHMQRDWSPTYWFRIRRAEQLLTLYRENPKEFQKVYDEYRNQVDPAARAPHRLTVWLRPNDLEYTSCDDIKKGAAGAKLVKAFDDPKYFGFTLRTTGAGAIGEHDLNNQEVYLHATPAALGTLTYIAFETRRLFEETKPKGEKFVPLEVTSLVRPRDYDTKAGAIPKDELPAHCSGQVFDISFSNMGAGERECLNFILDDLGDNGDLGFIQETNNTNVMHIGCAPTARDFFTEVYKEAIAHS